MNTDTPEGSTSGESAQAEEPTVALSVPDDSGDAEPTVTMSASEISEATVDLSSSAGAGPATDLPVAPSAADSGPGTPEPKPTVTSAAGENIEPSVTPDSAEQGPTVIQPSGEHSEPTVALSAGQVAAAVAAATEASEPTATLPAEEHSEPTVALSAEQGAVTAAPETSEPTVTLPGGEDSEPTVALSAGQVAAAVAAATEAGDAEPTTVISAGAPPVTALPKPRRSPESASTTPDTEPTVALSVPPTPVSRREQDSTVALPVAPQHLLRPGAEPTVALPVTAEPGPPSTVAVPAQRSAPTVAPPPSEPVVALQAVPSAPAVVPAPAKSFTRRRLLWAVPAVAGTALLGGTIAALAGRDQPDAGRAPNLVVTEPAPSQAPAPKPTTPQPTTPVMTVPVHTLKDFRAAVPGDPFPADAIALTIDDGPHPVWTPQILRLLEKYHVPALFCMIGNQVLGHESTARDVVADGHHIANHTWSHPLNVAKLSGRKTLKEIHRAQDKIYSTTGYAPSLFRAPGGAWSPGLAKSVSQSGVIPMDWSTDPRDWARPGVAHITNRLLASKPGQILLCHDGGGDRSQTLASLKTVIPALQAKGLTFVALT